MAIKLLLLLATCFELVFGQNTPIPLGALSLTECLLCNQSFADANGTGIYYYNPLLPQSGSAGAFDQADGTTLPVSLAGTLIDGQDTSSTTQVSFWFDTNGANYTDSLDLGFDACGFVAGPFSADIYARGARDDGSCHTMFDASCVSDLNTNAENFALDLTLSQSAVSSLDATSLPSVCSEVAKRLNSNLPGSCTRYFEEVAVAGNPAAFVGLPLTGINRQYNESCTMNGTYSLVATLVAVNNSLGVYDQLATGTLPIMFVYMPVANAARRNTIQQSNAETFCARMTNFTDGSRVPLLPSLAEQKTGLSKGVKAGIVIGAFLGAVLILWLSWRWYEKHKEAKKNHNKSVQDMALIQGSRIHDQYSEAPDSTLQQANTHGVHELDPRNYGASELEGDEHQAHERQAHELHGEAHGLPELHGEDHGPRELHGEYHMPRELPGSKSL